MKAAGSGKIVLHEMENTHDWRPFLDSMIALADVQAWCLASDSRLRMVPMTRRGGGLALFILNGSNRKVGADIFFQSEVNVSDLATYFTVRGPASDEVVPPSLRFSLEVPPCGVLPLSVEGLGVSAEERRAAAVTAEVVKQSVFEAAEGGLPGFSMNGGVDSPWS
jgi:hypothetical protein